MIVRSVVATRGFFSAYSPERHTRLCSREGRTIQQTEPSRPSPSYPPFSHHLCFRFASCPTACSAAARNVHTYVSRCRAAELLVPSPNTKTRVLPLLTLTSRITSPRANRRRAQRSPPFWRRNPSTLQALPLLHWHIHTSMAFRPRHRRLPPMAPSRLLRHHPLQWVHSTGARLLIPHFL